MARTTRDAHRRLGRPPDVNSTATRAALLVGARKTFAECGYDATTNRAIAEAAGVTAGAIYHYFSSKADLYIAVFLELQDRFEVYFEAAVANHAHLVDRYCALIDDAVELNRNEPTMAAFLVASAAEIRSHPELKERLSDTKMQRNDWLRRLAQDATANAEMSSEVDPRALEDLLGVVLSGLARFAHLSGDPDRHKAAADVLKRFLRGDLVT
jgi:AcrR family transcriptional regulator